LIKNLHHLSKTWHETLVDIFAIEVDSLKTVRQSRWMGKNWFAKSLMVQMSHSSNCKFPGKDSR